MNAFAIESSGAVVPMQEGQQSRRTLLVVDDEEGARLSLHILFRNEYHVLLADSGPAAIDLALQHKIDAAVLDIRMAGMSGIELLNHLKKIDSAIEVILLTAYETFETARQALRLGACDYLNKPFDIGTMRQAVANAMERRALSEEIQAHNRKLMELQNEIHHQRLREEVSRTRGEIYASILHDISGPLTVAAGFVDLMSRQLAQSPAIESDEVEVMKDRLARVMRQLQSCMEISKRYLGFLRGRPGDAGSVSINQILADTRDVLRTHPQAQKHAFAVHELPEDARVRINGTELMQILLNLAINAFQSSPISHHVEIRAERCSEPLNITSKGDDAEYVLVHGANFRNTVPLVAISVQDDGAGIPPEIVGRVFEPYFTTKPEGIGTGLGLVIVRRLVEQAEGAIRLQTRVGEGTAFTIFLPIDLTGGESAAE